MKKLVLLLSICVAGGAYAQIRISEFASGGSLGEFVEITNIGPNAVDLTGWSFDDSSRIPGMFGISALGTLGGGASAIITESEAATFRAGWSMPLSVAIVGLNDQNLSGNGDEMNIYDASNTLVDRLTYTAQAQPTISNNGPLAELGLNNYPAWVQSSLGDAFGSYGSSGGDIGNPGIYTPVPEPATLIAVSIALVGLVRRRNR